MNNEFIFTEVTMASCTEYMIIRFELIQGDNKTAFLVQFSTLTHLVYSCIIMA